MGQVIDKKRNIPSQYEGVPIDAKFTIMIVINKWNNCHDRLLIVSLTNAILSQYL